MSIWGISGVMGAEEGPRGSLIGAGRGRGAVVGDGDVARRAEWSSGGLGRVGFRQWACERREGCCGRRQVWQADLRRYRRRGSHGDAGRTNSCESSTSSIPAAGLRAAHAAACDTADRRASHDCCPHDTHGRSVQKRRHRPGARAHYRDTLPLLPVHVCLAAPVAGLSADGAGPAGG